MQGALILQLPATASGNVSPTSSLDLPAIFVAEAVATDSSGQLYVAIQTGSGGNVGWEVLVYPAGASGAATPTRTIVISSTLGPSAMAVDSSGSLYIANYGGQIVVYSSTANGVAVPTRTIGGPLALTGSDIAVDSSGNIYTDAIANNGPANSLPPVFTILVYPPTANGNVAPARVISVPSGVAAGCCYGSMGGIATDAAGDVYFEGETESSTGSPRNSMIMEVAAGASGTVTPLKTITGFPVGGAASLRLDAAGNLYFVGNDVQTQPSVGGYGPSSSGNESPSVTIISPQWGGIDSSIALR